jgi:crotonobetainyl-CoA:carnitine CoA-transferase CaiB-like acyl-CoA transferase
MSALAGLRIIDFTQGIAGPMACMLLGDFEPEVIKVEPPGGDRMHSHPGYLCWNRNKQRLMLDLHQYEGLRGARGLIATADVAVFDARPGELERLGLDAGTLLSRHPSLLHAWLPPYAPAGRWSQLPPDDGLLSAVSGVGWMQYSYEDRPVHLVSPQASYGHAMMAATAIAAGIYERARTGLGQALRVSGLDGVAAVETGGAVRAADVFRMGGRGSRGGAPNYRLYQCADGKWFFLGTLTPQFFFRALEAVGLLELMAMEGIDGEFANMQRPPYSEKVIAALDARFAEKLRDEWMEILQAHGVPKGPVGIREEWFASETVAANDMRLELHDERFGRVVMPGVPVKLSGTPGSVRGLPQDAPSPPGPLSRLRGRGGEAGAQPSSGGPLSGVKVLDLASFIAGTFAPCILAAMGADVVKVESPEGDGFRTYGLLFVAFNRGKRGISLDLKNPKGREAFYEMVKQADVVVDNYRVGVRERLGVDYATLSAINPRIITVSVTGYGPRGPLALDPGFDPLLQARSGIMAAQGGDDEPVFYQLPVNDTASAMMAAFGACVALTARERTGRGQEVQTSLAAQSVLCQSGELTWYEGRPPAPLGCLDCLGVSALQRYYQCEDGGWVAVACHRGEEFHQLCVALGHTEWAGRYLADRALCEPREGALAEAIAATFAGLTTDDAIDRLHARGVPAAPALSLAGLFDDPFLRENGFLEDYEHPDFGTITGVAAYAHWSRTRSGMGPRAPLLGEHTLEVLQEFGFNEARIGELLGEGVVR